MEKVGLEGGVSLTFLDEQVLHCCLVLEGGRPASTLSGVEAIHQVIRIFLLFYSFAVTQKHGLGLCLETSLFKNRANSP